MSPPTGTNQRDDEDVMPRVEVIAKDLQEALRLGVKESPLLTFAVAGALGYMLGGGLTPGILARLVGVGIRTAVGLRAQQAITDWLRMEGWFNTARQT